MFHYAIFYIPLIFCYFIFYSKIALWPISYAAKVFAAKMLEGMMSIAKMLKMKIPDKKNYKAKYKINIMNMFK